MVEKPTEIILKYVAGEGLDNPEELSRNLLILSAYLGVLGKEITEAEVAYARKWQSERINYKTDKQAEMALKLAPEYSVMENKKSGYRMLQELIRSIKKRLSVLSDDRKESIY